MNYVVLHRQAGTVGFDDPLPHDAQTVTIEDIVLNDDVGGVSREHERIGAARVFEIVILDGQAIAGGYIQNEAAVQREVPTADRFAVAVCASTSDDAA